MTQPISEEQIEHILFELGEKKRSLSDICKRDKGMPRATSFLGVVAKNAELSERYARAREAQITAKLEEIIEIADNATDDVQVIYNPVTKKHVAKIDGQCVRRAQLMIEARERFAKMMMPERFAQQRMDVTSGGKALPTPQNHDNRLDALLLLAAQRAMAAVEKRGELLVDVTPVALDDVMS